MSLSQGSGFPPPWLGTTSSHRLAAETDQGWQSNQQQQPGAANLHRGGVSHLTGFGVTVVELRPMIRQGGGIGGTGEHSGVD